jgi:hypothetical protein
METVIGVVDQLISIGNESKMYKGNALQFLDHRSFYEGNPDPNECTNLTISIKDLTILLGQSKDKGALERIATANMEFDVSAVLVGEKPERLNFDVVSLTLQSPGGYTLISIVSDGPLSPVFVKFTKHHAGQDEILLSVPLFEVWLYLQDWNTIINHSHSYVKTEVNSMPVDAAAWSQFPETASSPLIASEFGSPDDFNLVVTCETVAGVLHIPIWGKEENHTSNRMGVTSTSFPSEVGTHHEADDIQYCEPKGCKFVTLTFESKHFVVMSGDSCMNFKCDLERLKVMLEMIQENKGTSVPFVHISKVKSSGYVHQSERNLEHLSVDLQAEYMDLSFSHQIFNFWHNMELKFPAASSASSFYSVTFKAGLRKGSLLLNDGRVSSVTVLLVPLLNIN